jgi:hypothetical protein
MRDPSPRRVRNIFICMEVAFCASSSTMKAWTASGPRMNASGRDLDDLLLDHLLHLLGGQEVVQRVVERLHVGVDLLLGVAGQEAQPLARLHGGARQDDPVHMAAQEHRHAHGHGEIGLAVPAGPIPKASSWLEEGLT